MARFLLPGSCQKVNEFLFARYIHSLWQTSSVLHQAFSMRVVAAVAIDPVLRRQVDVNIFSGFLDSLQNLSCHWHEQRGTYLHVNKLGLGPSILHDNG